MRPLLRSSSGSPALADQNPGWPRMRIGVNSGSVIVHEVGGDGHVAYPVPR